LIGAVISLATARVEAGQQSTRPQLPSRDAVLIAEAYHLWKTLGEKLWTGWTSVQIPFIYVTSDYEYAIGFPKRLSGFTELEQNALLKKSVQARAR
ncbi:MAG: hypothetical protein M3362_16845, partial [Acidobacteriota bacterium]|nr:hypothetical protein [Acidobacteriota bacterium]